MTNMIQIQDIKQYKNIEQCKQNMAKWNANICRIHEKHIRTYSTCKKEIHVLYILYMNHITLEKMTQVQDIC